MTFSMDVDEVFPAADLIGRAGARTFELGWLIDDVPIELADWWASANFQGVKIQVEHHRGPVEAASALALRILIGAKYSHCQKLVALDDDGAFAYFRATLLDGTIWNAEDAAAAGQCRWYRDSKRWVRGCE